MSAGLCRYAQCSVPEQVLEEAPPKVVTNRPPPWVLGAANIDRGSIAEGGKLSYRCAGRGGSAVVAWFPVSLSPPSRRSDLIYGSWGGRAKSNSANYGRGTAARESHARFNKSSLYQVPPEDVGWLLRRRAGEDGGGEGGASGEERSEGSGGEEDGPTGASGGEDVAAAASTATVADSTGSAISSAAAAAAEEVALHLRMTPDQLTDVVRAVVASLEAPSKAGWYTAYEVVRGVSASVLPSPATDPTLFPDMLQDVVEVRFPFKLWDSVCVRVRVCLGVTNSHPPSRAGDSGTAHRCGCGGALPRPPGGPVPPPVARL